MGSADNVDKAMKALKAHNKKMSRLGTPVMVGLPAGSLPYPDGTSVLLVGTVHEFGSPSRGIPARSFLRSTLIKQRTEFKQQLSKLAKKVSKDKTNPIEALGLLGTFAAAEVKTTITTSNGGAWPVLKHRDGKPLMDTGHLRASITYQVGGRDDD